MLYLSSLLYRRIDELLLQDPGSCGSMWKGRARSLCFVLWSFSAKPDPDRQFDPPGREQVVLRTSAATIEMDSGAEAKPCGPAGCDPHHGRTSLVEEV